MGNQSPLSIEELKADQWRFVFLILALTGLSTLVGVGKQKFAAKKVAKMEGFPEKLEGKKAAPSFISEKKRKSLKKTKN